MKREIGASLAAGVIVFSGCGEAASENACAQVEEASEAGNVLKQYIDAAEQRNVGGTEEEVDYAYIENADRECAMVDIINALEIIPPKNEPRHFVLKTREEVRGGGSTTVVTIVSLLESGRYDPPIVFADVLMRELTGEPVNSRALQQSYTALDEMHRRQTEIRYLEFDQGKQVFISTFNLDRILQRFENYNSDESSV